MKLGTQDVERLVSERLASPGWTVAKPKDGWSETSFVAERNRRRVFVKFYVSIPILARLAKLQIAPPLIHTGRYRGRPFVIQQFIEGPYPDRRWFADHLADVARLVRRYHRDEGLRALCARMKSTDWEEHPQSQSDDAARRIGASRSALFKSAAFAESLRLFEALTARLDEVALVPTHGDPSRKNFLIVDAGAVLVDWDELRLADPMRDLGPLVWWYIGTNRWDEFFKVYGEGIDEALLNRLYWWAAETSLDIALSLVERRYPETRAGDFLEDFAAAVRKEDNPHFETS